LTSADDDHEPTESPAWRHHSATISPWHIPVAFGQILNNSFDVVAAAARLCDKSLKIYSGLRCTRG